MKRIASLLLAVLAVGTASNRSASAGPLSSSRIGQAEAAILDELVRRSSGEVGTTAAAPSPAFVFTQPRVAQRPAAPMSWLGVPASRSEIEPLVASAALQGGIDATFFRRLIRQESGFNPVAVSSAGAQGIAQFMPATALMVGLDDPFDPVKALPKSAAFLAMLQRRLGNEGLAAAAYNAGEGRVREWLSGRSMLPLETRNYVLAITGREAHEWAPTDVVRRVVLTSNESGASRNSWPAPSGAFTRLAPEWSLAVTLSGGPSRLNTLIQTAGQAPVPPRSAASSLRVMSAAPSSEQALCESFRGKGCIVARVY